MYTLSVLWIRTGFITDPDLDTKDQNQVPVHVDPYPDLDPPNTVCTQSFAACDPPLHVLYVLSA
jgi:hypothetical protein